ncbi:hypothetical protein [Kribbella sp. NPDC048928]|uniref:hypothetical protein n=1 Tax=Kribbella sp. NPDC048928 TaxID=3364111 RepID=UPI003715D47D
MSAWFGITVTLAGTKCALAVSSSITDIACAAATGQVANRRTPSAPSARKARVPRISTSRII